MRFVTFIQLQPKWLIMIEGLFLLALVGVVDYATGRTLSVSLLYAIVIVAMAWFHSGRLAWVFAFLSAAIWWLANKEVHPFGSDWSYAWATLSRLITFIMIAAAGSILKVKHESDALRIQALERAKDLEQEIARISEHEQRRIGQDLHDGICQVLAAIRCAISSVRDDLQAKGLPEAKATGEAAEMLGSAIVEIRNLARGIFPVQMAVLDEMVETTQRLHRIQITFESEGDVNVRQPEVAMHLYRIAQEALSNAVKHGGARHVAVKIAKADGVLTLTVSDDGCGFIEAEGSTDSMGLKTMRYRAGLIGAELSVNNQRDGVTVNCRLPGG